MDARNFQWFLVPNTDQFHEPGEQRSLLFQLISSFKPLRVGNGFADESFV